MKLLWMLKMEREVFGLLSELSETQPGQEESFALISSSCLFV